MYNRKKELEHIPEESTKIWTCETEGCNMWMRDNFTFASVPNCVMCNAPMVSGEKVLPVLINSNTDWKS